MDGRTVLVVEDNASLRMAIVTILKQDGYTVLSAADGMQALDVMKNSQPGLILADIAMPVMDGYEFYRAVRDRPEWTSIPFIFLTGRSQHDDVIKGKALGVEGYLVKPVDPEELLVTLRARLDRAQAVRTSAEAGLEQIKDQIVTVLGHEMRTPLTYIRGYTDLAREDLGSLAPEQLETFLRGISQGADRLIHLSEDFLVLIRLDTGQIKDEYLQLVSRRNDLSRVIENVISDFEPRAAARAVTLEGRVELDLPPVYLSELFFADALGRLIENALKFSDNAENRVTVHAHRQGSWVHIDVVDEGVGIRDEEIPHLFQRFHQIDRRKMEQQGLGLGLAIAKELIDLHGGKISVKSVFGAGSTFTIELPSAALDEAVVA